MTLTFDDRMAVAAHRGDSYNYYENTMTAFKMAEKSGCDMIETDVHLSLDDELVIIHDHRVDRTTDGKGEIEQLTLKELKNLNAGDVNIREEIPTFDEFIEWVFTTSLTVNIEIKEYWSEKNEERCIRCIEKVIALVEKYNLRDRIVINSFDAWVLNMFIKNSARNMPCTAFTHTTK